ncbi:hypothetical protein [Streptomyces sp. NPDC094032]|uniref:hypothetical protein n=1 Tax=Streptomyces sp. NPDC094032 TaxID=3155308 RepID=UPI00332C541F
MQNQGTPAPRAAAAIPGARAARRRAEFVDVVARQLHQIAPGTVRVRTVPVLVEDRRRMWVELIDATGGVVSTSADQCRQAYGLLRRGFPAADWTRPRLYLAPTGELVDDTPRVPAELGIDTAPEVTA